MSNFIDNNKEYRKRRSSNNRVGRQDEVLGLSRQGHESSTSTLLGDQPDLDEQARHRGSFDERNQRHGLVGLPDSDPIPNAAAASYGLLEQVGADLPLRQDEPAFADE